MPEPGSTNAWLMYHVATAQVALPQRIAGYARNSGGFTPWLDSTPMWSTDVAHFQGAIESPHVFGRSTGLWYLFFTTPSGHPIRYQFASAPTSDSTGWNGTYRLFDNDPSTDPWFASEYLRAGGHEYLAAANSANDGIEIRELVWTGASSFQLTTPSVVGVERRTVSERIGLRILSNVPGRDLIELECIARQSGLLRMDVLDVQGRSVYKIFEGKVGPGRRVVAWNSSQAAGSRPADGIYFVRASMPDGAASLRVVLFR